MNIYLYVYIYKNRYYYTYITEEKPTPLIYCLQKLQEKICGTHLWISVLQMLRELLSSISAGTIFQILGSK